MSILTSFEFLNVRYHDLSRGRVHGNVFSTMLEFSILYHKSQEAASAASWECLKIFSFLLSVKTWFEPIVFPGSLAILKSRGEAAHFCG
jgi:hypothetical protein